MLRNEKFRNLFYFQIIIYNFLEAYNIKNTFLYLVKNRVKLHDSKYQ